MDIDGPFFLFGLQPPKTCFPEEKSGLDSPFAKEEKGI